jgi:hypothetical protein
VVARVFGAVLGHGTRSHVMAGPSNRAKT